MQQMDNYAMSIYKNARKVISANTIAGIATTRTLKMCYHIAKKHRLLKYALAEAKKAKDAKKIKELNDKLKHVNRHFYKYQKLARIETENIRYIQRYTGNFVNLMHEQYR